jgi:hypothetical protein
MRKIRVDFCDFWPGFRKDDNFFWHLLKKRFAVELHTEPDFLFYSDRQRHVHRGHNCVKICFPVEAFLPDWEECDYAFTCHYVDDPRHMRLPLYVLYAPAEQLIRRGDENWGAVLAAKKNFCALVVGKVTRRKPEKRVEFFQKLSRYKKVDSAGGALNNMGFNVPHIEGAKVEFLRSYKFNIAFENASLPGYTTEKIVEPMQARCLPVYYGNPRVTEEFNTASFINYEDYKNDEAVIEQIIALDKDDAKYLARLKAPNFISNQANEFYDEERLLRQFEMIFSASITPVSQRRRRLVTFGRWLLVKRNRPLAIGKS